jgi:hypothetical protein
MRAWAFLVTATVVGCGEKNGSQGDQDGSQGQHFDPPELARIVNASLPASLKPGGTTPMPRLAPAPTPTATLEMLGAKYIRNLFQNSYPGNLDASPVVGYLNAQLSTIDARFAEAAGFSGDCFSDPPKTFTADLSAVIDPTMKITLPNLQCAVGFTPATDGSGEVFGSDGQGNTSQWIALGQTPTGGFANTGGFLSYANVLHLGSTDPAAPEEVDGMLAAYLPGTTFGSATRFKASSTAGTFELFFASNGGAMGGPNGPVYLGDGFRMISDGTLIYADGVLLDFDNMAGGMQPFSACIAASTLLPTANLSDCDALAATFTFATTPSLDYCDIVGAGAGCTIPVPSFNMVPMAPSVVAAIDALFPISARPSGIPIINNAN